MCGFFISELQTESHPQRIAGTLVHFNVRQGKRGRFAFATLDDSTGKIEVSIWADVFEKYRNLLKTKSKNKTRIIYSNTELIILACKQTCKLLQGSPQETL